MKVNLGIWHILTQLVIGLLAAAAIVGVGLWYLPLIRKNEGMRKQIFELESRIKIEEAQARRFETAIAALKTDPKAVERLAREKLGFARPGETVFFFEDRNSQLSPAIQPGR